ncbi:hypothetical protein [Nocardia sp. IFM 10818]
MAVHEYTEPVLYAASGGALLTAITRISIAYMAFRKDGIDAKHRKEIIDGLSRLFKWRRP